MAAALLWLAWLALQSTDVGPWLALLRGWIDVGIGWFLLLGVAALARTHAQPQLARYADVSRITGLAIAVVANALLLPLWTREQRASCALPLGVLAIGCSLLELWLLLQCAALETPRARFRRGGDAAETGAAPAG